MSDRAFAVTQAEKYLLGVVLSRPERLAECESITAEHFTDVRHGAIWGAIISLRGDEQPIEPAGVLKKLEALGWAGTIAPVVLQLYDPVTGGEDITPWLEQVSTAHALRQLRAIGEHAGKPTADLPRLLAQVESIKQPANNNQWLALAEDAADIITLDLPPVVEVIEGLVTEQAKFLIGSGSKSFKTWLTIDAALSIAHQRPFLGRATTRRRVLYVNLELKPNTFRRRVQTIARAKGIEIDRSWFHHLPLRGKMSGKPVSEIVSAIIAIAQHLKAQVVVLDPIFKMNLEGEENNSRDQTLFFNEIDRITTEAGATVILNDHFSKGNQSEKDPLDAIRGSSAKGGDVDAAMVMRRHETDDCFRVDVVHRELPPIEPFCVQWQFPLMQVRGDLNPEKMQGLGGRPAKHKVEKLLSAIADTSADNAVSVVAWANRAEVNRTTLIGYLTEMRTKGWIATIGAGNNARQYITEEGRKAAA